MFPKNPGVYTELGVWMIGILSGEQTLKIDLDEKDQEDIVIMING